MLTFGVVFVFAFVLGILLTLLVEAIFIYKVFLKCPEAKPPQPTVQSCELPADLLETIRDSSWKKQKFPCLTENLLLHFLFREWKDTPQLRRWLMKKLRVEFLEIQKTLTGRFIEQITVRDLQLGSNVPVFKSASIEKVLLHEKKKTIEEVSLHLALEYAGGFQLAVDVQTVLGRKAFLSVRVTRLRGIARLQLTRRPYSHWSFTFTENPDVDFAVESHLQGHAVPQLTSVIVTQIRKSLRKKHTLPNFKMRFKPFIPSPELGLLQETCVPEEEPSEGLLAITVVECSRLFFRNDAHPFVYCTVAIDTSAWVELSFAGGKSWYTKDVEVSRKKNERVGITFKEEEGQHMSSKTVVVSSLVASAPAHLAGIKKDDILLSVNGVKVLSVKHAAKLLKQAFGKFYLRVRRETSVLPTSETPEVLRDFETILDKDSGEDFGFVTISRKEAAITTVKPKVEKKTERPVNFEKDFTDPFVNSKTENSVLEASSTPNTPKKEIQGSVKSSLQGSLPDLRIGENENKSSDQMSEEETKSASSKKDGEIESEHIHHSLSKVSVQKTSLVKVSEDPQWKESLLFQFDKSHRFINVGVWCRDQESSSHDISLPREYGNLLGHVSIPLLPVLKECSSVSQGFHVQTFNLLPPDMAVNKSPFEHWASHSGFNEHLCYGDITFTFMLHDKAPEGHDGKRHSSKSSLEEESPKISGSSGIKKKASELISACHHKKHLHATRESIHESEDEMLIVEADHVDGAAGIYGKNHTFSSTRFQNATVCFYCKKKIWLKVAFQCSVCEMICHKKCVSRCQAKFACLGESEEAWSASQENSANADIDVDGTNPEDRPDKATKDIISAPKETGLFRKKAFAPLSAAVKSDSSMGVNSDVPSTTPKTRRKGIQQFFSNLAGSAHMAAPLNRAGSDHNLNVPSNQLASASSKSLPPSPQRSPAQSRKSSLQGNQAQWLTSLSLEDQDINKVIEGLLALPHDEGVLSLAKERGKELYSEFSSHERKDKLNAMIAKLQKAIDGEVETRLELSKEDQKDLSPGHKTRLAFQIGKCDERMQALSVLMLHYFSGLQHCLDCEGAIAQNDSLAAEKKDDIPLKPSEDIPFLCIHPPDEGEENDKKEDEEDHKTSEESMDLCKDACSEKDVVHDVETSDDWIMSDAAGCCIESDSSSELSELELTRLVPNIESSSERVATPSKPELNFN